VDIEEAKTDEGVEVVNAERAGAVLQVGHRPCDEKNGEGRIGIEELVPTRLERVRAQPR
jgi:hypothetical protein